MVIGMITSSIIFMFIIMASSSIIIASIIVLITVLIFPFSFIPSYLTLILVRPFFLFGAKKKDDWINDMVYKILHSLH